jgi:hypothetical protein
MDMEQQNNVVPDELFPALHKYKVDHSIDNLQKLCVEVVDFCKAIYASTQNQEERDIYQKIFSRILKP